MAKSDEPFNNDDVRALNESSHQYVTRLSSSELKARVGAISFNSFGDSVTMDAAQEVLDEYGIVVFSNVVEPAVCAGIRKAIDQLTGRYIDKGQTIVEDDEVLFQVGSEKLKGFYQLANYNKAVITVRQGQDQGMLDIFNCDLALGETLKPVSEAFGSSFTLGVINSQALQPQNLNAYVNDSITSTRGFHVDSYSEHLKAFIYLSDVDTLADGPYTYVKGSHVDSAYRRANIALCGELTPSTEAPIVDLESITPVLASSGSLVISDQAGVHRGWPQKEGRRRMAAVMKYA